jgi:hypothetical protein
MFILSPISKMTATYFSETSLNIYHTKRYHISEDINLRNHHCENLKSHIRRILCLLGSDAASSLVESNVSEES